MRQGNAALWAIACIIFCGLAIYRRRQLNRGPGSTYEDVPGPDKGIGAEIAAL